MLNLVDTSLRDGMHSVRHQFTPAQVAEVARGLDRAGVGTIEVAHGDGIGGSSIQYGISAADDNDYVEAAAGAVERARVAVLLLPGIGTVEHLRQAQACGATVARIATHCTEADVAQQHIPSAREAGMHVIGFLMMSHMVEPGELAAQAKLMQSYGTHVVYVVDSAGAMTPPDAVARVEALLDAVDCEVGFHAHNNLGCGVANALAAAAAGATWLDGSCRGLGAGAGNAATEVLCTALDRAGHETGIDLFGLMDVAEDVVSPLMPRPQIIDRASLVLGYAGVYSSFLLHAETAAEKYGVDARELLVELGRRRTVGGQEDMIIEVAAELARGT
ncbi:MAG: 4-hydroxy 2-oxovalerate aldolase [Thermoleophilaceae bacterium]|jgi:4-hydroxy-2-oxovalerate aldolase|nr:4-hydroxy 2-oxovalerate aldolase [Thermoleophilaceae bacterium]